jgi:hypothetical protein
VLALSTLVAGAYLAGQRWSQIRPVLTATTTEQLRALPRQPGVLQVRPGDARENPQAESPSTPLPTGGQQQPAQSRKRAAGLNYIIIQSYPDKEKEMATAAMNLLIQNGIDCTIEQGLAGWKPNWYMVVGLAGFKSPITTSPEYDAYINLVRKVSDKHADRKSFKAFDPQPVKWK